MANCSDLEERSSNAGKRPTRLVVGWSPISFLRAVCLWRGAAGVRNGRRHRLCLLGRCCRHNLLLNGVELGWMSSNSLAIGNGFRSTRRGRLHRHSGYCEYRQAHKENSRPLCRLFLQIECVLEVNELTATTDDVVNAARSNLVIDIDERSTKPTR